MKMNQPPSLVPRFLLGVLLGLGLAGCGGNAPSADEPLHIGVITTENQTDTAQRHDLLAAYLSRKIGRPVELREASDYAAVVEAMKSKRLDLAYFGPASYAKAWIVTRGGVVPLVSHEALDGTWGYHSVIVVRADSPFQTIEGLHGKSFAFVDPNSTSGYQSLQFFLTKQGYPPEQFFGRTGFSGNHDNGVLAVLNGTYDAAPTWWNNDEYNNVRRMGIKGMIDDSQLRFIWKSPALPDDAWTVRSDIPAELREKIKQAFLTLKEDDPEAWARLTDGLVGGFREVNHEDYAHIVEMVRYNLDHRKNTP